MAQPSASTSISTSTSKFTSVPDHSKLVFEKKNTNMLHIPGSSSSGRKFRIEKRPILRPSVASPYAGSSVPKTVYVGSKTPFMSAIKRIRKLLALAERRAMMPILGKKRSSSLSSSLLLSRTGQRGGAGGGDVEKAFEKCRQRLKEDKVLVKATGRAIEKALDVAKWFEEGGRAQTETGQQYDVVVKTGSVCVVDDIVEVDDEEEEEEEAADCNETKEEEEEVDDHDITMTDSIESKQSKLDNPANKEVKNREEKKESKKQRLRRRKRERVREQRLKAFCDEDGETPESRTRWINMVEIAINMN